MPGGIVVKHVAAQSFLSLGATGERVETLFERVIEHMTAAGADRSLPVSWRWTERDVVHVRAGYASIDDVPGLDVTVLPAASVASVVHRGPVTTLGDAVDAVRVWADAHGHSTSERWREVYLETDDDRADWVVEVQLELSA